MDVLDTSGCSVLALHSSLGRGRIYESMSISETSRLRFSDLLHVFLHVVPGTGAKHEARAARSHKHERRR